MVAGGCRAGTAAGGTIGFMADHEPAARLAALSTDGTLTVLDVSPILQQGRERLLDILRRRVGGASTACGVDRVRVATRAGWLLVFKRELGREAATLPENLHARRLLERLGMDLGREPGSHPGSFLFLGSDDGGDVEAGLSDQQIALLQSILGTTAVRSACSGQPDAELVS